LLTREAILKVLNKEQGASGFSIEAEERARRPAPPKSLSQLSTAGRKTVGL
jgi:hypothetical protein